MTEKEWSSLKESPEYKLWRREVYSRDGYKCALCGSTERIEAHHIYPLRSHFDKRFDIGNGITLCQKDHRLLNRRELEYAKLFLELVEKNGVNSVKLRKDNTEPSIERNFDEGVTTRSRHFTLEQFGIYQVPCVACGKKLTRHYYRLQRSKKFFCDSKCRSSYLKNKLPPWTKGKLIQYCLWCGKETSTPTDQRRKKKYCNNQCQAKYQIAQKKANNASTKTLGESQDIV